MLLKIEFKNHGKVLSFFIVTSILILLGCIFIGWDSEAVLFVFLFYSILSLPSFYLHIEYYLRNRGQQLEILNDEIILHKRKGATIRLANADLKKIILYKSASLEKGGIPMTPLESYHYAEIISKHDEVIIITCLMSTDIEKALKEIKGVPMVKKRRLFASFNYSLPRLLEDKEHPA